MQRLVLSVIGILVLISVVFGQSTQNVYVLNTLGQTVSRVDLATGAVQKDAITAGLYTNQVVIRKDKMYIVNSGDNAIQIVDIQNLATVDSINVGPGTNPYYMDLVNDSIAVVSLLFTNQIAVVNVASGEIITTVSTGGGPEGIKYVNGKVYVANSGYNGQGYDPGTLTVIDATTWQVVDTISVGLNPQYIDVDAEGHLYVACTGNYVDVTGELTIVDTAADTVIAHIALDGYVTSLDFNNNRVYLATYGAGVFVYDVAGDSLFSTVLPGGPGVLVDSDGYAYITNFGSDSLYVYDSNFQRVAAFEVGDGPISVAVDDPALTAISAEPHVAIPGAFQLYQNFPNPFNPNTTIRFALSTASMVRLDILNILGQRIRTLVDGPMVAGMHQMEWNGTDESGQRVPSGVYFYRLMVNGQQQIRKMQLIQ